MYHGGNNYGRSAAAGVTTKYADGVNLHSDGLSNEPKRSHLRKLHEVLAASTEVLMESERQIAHSILLSENGLQRAFVYGGGPMFVVFVENMARIPVTTVFNHTQYLLAPKSIIILNESNHVLFDTAAVILSYPYHQRRVYHTLVPAESLTWLAWVDDVSLSTGTQKKMVAMQPKEQLFVTQDESDYLIYETTFHVKSPELNPTTLSFTSCDANAFIIYLDHVPVTEVSRGFPGENCSITFQVVLPRLVLGSDHTLTFVSISLGLSSLGKRHRKGLTGEVVLNGHQQLHRGNRNWTMVPGLIGEHFQIYDRVWQNSVPWYPIDRSVDRGIWMTWYRSIFRMVRPPQATKHMEQTTVVLLDCIGLSRGRVYINGHDLGRYWLIENEQNERIQRYYHIPIDWLNDQDKDNELVVFDELGGSIRDIRIVLSSMVELARGANNLLVSVE